MGSFEVEEVPGLIAAIVEVVVEVVAMISLMSN